MKRGAFQKFLLVAVLSGCSVIGGSSIDVIAQHGDVRVRCDSIEWVELNDEFELGRDCEFATGGDAKLALQLGKDAAIELRPGTLIRVFGAGASKTPAVEVSRGSIFARAKPREIPAVAVRTPVVAVGIRGTSFVVWHDPATGQSAVGVVEGRVEAVPLNTALAPVELQAGQEIYVTAAAISPIMPLHVVPPPALLDAAAASTDSGLRELWNSIREKVAATLSSDEAHHDDSESPTPASGFSAMQIGMDIADGADYHAVDIPDAQPLSCQQICAADPRCRAYAYVVPGTYNYPNARCWLKAQPGRFIPHANAVSAVKEEVQEARGTIEVNIDRPGSDFSNFDLPQAEPPLCMLACQQADRCVAYTYVKPGVQGPSARCWLKHGVPAPVSNQCCVSGFMHR